MSIRKLRTVLAMAITSVAAFAQATPVDTTLDFEDVWAADEWRYTYEMWQLDSPIVTQGYVLRWAPGPDEQYLTWFHAMGPLWQWSATQGISINPNGCSGSVTLMAEDGGAFQMHAIDLQELNGVDDVGVSVTFTGLTVDGKTVTHTATLNNRPAWDRVHLPGTFRNLTQVVWHQGNCYTNKPHMFDNVRLSNDR